MKLRNSLVWILALLVALCILFTGCDMGSTSTPDDDVKQTVQSDTESNKKTESETKAESKESQKEIQVDNKLTLADIKPFSGSPYIVINGNQPNFSKSEITTKAYEFYSPLDSLGRCGYAMACLGKETMPAEGEERGDISKVKPTGWINNAYDAEIVPGRYLYNRCHLIGWQLSAENANKQNLITGTRNLNNDGMLPFENMIADYIKETGNHVMYRITPMFDGNNLVASGVHMEAYSVEDKGSSDGILINVYIYNVQPGIIIDYATGENKLANSAEADGGNDNTVNDENNDENASGDNITDDGGSAGDPAYILNTNSKKIHKPDCKSVGEMSEKNKQEYSGALADKIAEGYTTCGICKPE